jgi:C-terminal processing protease CtpA/Prc
MYAVLHKKPTYYNFIDSTELSFENWKMTIDSLNDLPKTNTSFYTTFRDNLFKPNNPLFKGKVYVLVNSDIHSAGLITATLLDYYTNAIFIGTPICGPYNSGNAIDFPTLTLPNSKLEVVIPLIHYHCSVPDNLYPYKKGIRTDIIIKPKISDILNNKDIILDTTLKIIKTKNYTKT